MNIALEDVGNPACSGSHRGRSVVNLLVKDWLKSRCLLTKKASSCYQVKVDTEFQFQEKGMHMAAKSILHGVNDFMYIKFEVESRF